MGGKGQAGNTEYTPVARAEQAATFRRWALIEAGAYVGQFVGVHGFAGGIVIGRVYLRIANPTGAGAATSRSGTLSQRLGTVAALGIDRKSTRLNSSHVRISYAVFCLKKKK